MERIVWVGAIALNIVYISASVFMSWIESLPPEVEEWEGTYVLIAWFVIAPAHLLAYLWTALAAAVAVWFGIRGTLRRRALAAVALSSLPLLVSYIEFGELPHL